MSNIRTHLVNGLKCAKLAVGPTISSPGPILLIVAVTAVKLVTKSFSSSETTSKEKTKITKKVTKYTLVAPLLNGKRVK